MLKIFSSSRPSVFQWPTAALVSSSSAWPIGLVEGPEAKLGQELAHFLGDELEEVHDELGLPVKRLRSSGFCVATPTGQVSRWQTRIMMQPGDHQGCCGEAELLGAQQRGDDHVAAGLQLAVDLHDDAFAQAVEHQRLLGLGQAELPGHAGVLERVQRRRAGAAVVAGDQDDVGLGLGDAGRDRADADLG